MQMTTSNAMGFSTFIICIYLPVTEILVVKVNANRRDYGIITQGPFMKMLC